MSSPTTDEQFNPVAAAVSTARPKTSFFSFDRFFGASSQIFLIIWAILVIFPFLWMVMTAFKTDPEIIFSPWKLPATLQWNNFSRAWSGAHIGTYFKNTIIVVTSSVFLTLLLSSMTAYVLARFKFPGNRFIFYLFMAGLMFPVFLALVPLFFVVNDLHMLSTYRGLILVYVAYSLPFSIFFLTSFSKRCPVNWPKRPLSMELRITGCFSGSCCHWPNLVYWPSGSSMCWGNGTSSSCRWCSTLIRTTT